MQYNIINAYVELWIYVIKEVARDMNEISDFIEILSSRCGLLRLHSAYIYNIERINLFGRRSVEQPLYVIIIK